MRINPITFEAPCDIYSHNARLMNYAMKHTGVSIQVEKLANQKSCDGSSLLALLSLGIQKGDQIKLTTLDEKADLREVVKRLHEVVS